MPAGARPACGGDRMAPRRSLVVLGLAVCLLAAGCTQHTIYRAHRPYDITMPKGVGLSVIEFDDHGEFWDRQQLDYALGKIGLAQQAGGAIVVTFMHGWNNNASRGHEDDPGRNLYKFKAVLEKIAALEAAGAGAEARPVVGVFLAWRGEANHPWLQFLSFYSRYSAAQKVGNGGAVTEALLAIAGVVRSNPQSQSVLVGHSFGGLIVEKALSEVVVKLATQSVFRPHAADGTFRVERAEFPADLIVLVNPASPSLYARTELSAIERWQLKAKEPVNEDYVCRGTPDWRPLIVSVTSVGDAATGLAFPMGTSLGYALERYRTYTYASPNPDRPPIDNAPHPQRYYYTHTEGHVAELQSHALTFETAAGGQEGVVTPCSDDPCQEPDRLCYVSGHSRFTLTRNRQSLNQNTPYWMMQAPVTLIKDHGDIFNTGFVEMLGGLLEVTKIVRPTHLAARPPAPPAH
jgi:hypothetical protein